MRLSETNTVDFMGTEKGTGTVLATLMDDFDGTDQERRLGLLQMKMERYLDFVESGEVYTKESKVVDRAIAAPTPVKIAIIARHRLDADGERFLAEAREIAASLGVTVSFEVIDFNRSEGGSAARLEHS